MLGKLLWHALPRNLIIERKIWNGVLWPAQKLDQILPTLLAPQFKPVSEKRNGTAATSSSRLAAILALTVSDYVSDVPVGSQHLWRDKLLITHRTKILGDAGAGVAHVMRCFAFMTLFANDLFLIRHQVRMR